MKKALSFILVLAMVLSMIPAVYAAETVVITSGTDVAVTATDKITHTWTASSDGTLTVTMGAATPGWRFSISDAAGNTVGLPKSGKTEKSNDFDLTAGTEYTFTAYGWNSSAWAEAATTLTYTLSFVAAEGEEVVVSDYEVSETALALGDNTLALLDTAVTTIYVFEPTETAVYTFTAPEGAILGYWGAGSWFLSDPGSTTNTYEWTCTGVGQSAYIGVSGVEGSFNLNVAKTGDYTVVETPIVPYENKATLETFTLPEGSTLGSYIDVTAETKNEAILGEDGYYHLNSADGDIILVDMNYQDIVLSAALKSDRPVMYVHDTDADGNKVKYDIGDAVLAYEAVMDGNGYYPLTEDLIYFYDNYANGAAIYTFYVSGNYNQDNIWMYCMRTVTFPEVTEPEVTEPEVTEPEATEPEATEPEVTEPEPTEPEATEPASSEPVSGTLVLDATATAESGSKYTHKFAPETAGTLTVTVGDGSTTWVSDVYSFATFKAIASSSGTAEDTYTAELNAGTNYYIRVYASSGALAATPVKAVFTPAGGSIEPSEPEATEPEVTVPEVTEPEATEPKVTEPEATEPSEPADPNALISLTNEAVTANGYVFQYTAATAGTLHVSVGECDPGWRYKVFSPDGIESGYRSKFSAGTECDYHNVAGNWKIIFYAYSSTEADNVEGTVSFKITFTPDASTGGEVEKDEYEVSNIALTVGNNRLTLLDTAVNTIYKFKPTATGTYTITAPEGATIGYWGANTNYLVNPGSTTNTCQWTCTSVGQSAYIGVSDVDGEFTLLIEAVAEPTEPEVTEPETTKPEETEPNVTVPSQPDPSIPSIDDEDVPSDAVYSITIDGQTTYFNTTNAGILNTQLKNITDTGYVKLYKDISLGTSISNALTFNAGNVTLDLNGCTISFAYASVGALYVDGATLTVIDTSAAGDGLVENTHTSGYGIEVWNGTVYLKSGSIYGGSNGVRLYDAGDTFYMEGGNLTAQRYAVNAIAGTTAHISGGTLQATLANQYALYAASTATVTISGGHFNGTVSGSGLNGKISGGYFIKSISANYIASGCELQSNDDAVYLYKVYNPNAVEPEPTEPTEPEVTEPEATEPEATEPEATEPEVTEPEETEPSEPASSEPENTEPEETEPSGAVCEVTNETVTADGYTFEYSAATAGTLNVTVGTCSPGWRYKITTPDGTESIYRTKWTAGESCDYEGEAGIWKIVFYAYSSAEADNVNGTVSFTVTFTPAEGGSGEVEKAEFEISDTALALGDNTLTLLDTAVTTIYVFEPTETAVYSFTAPEGAILGYWGGGSWFLNDPGSTTNTYEWTCTGVGQSAYIGVSGVDGSFNLNVAKTGDYTVVEIPIIPYENKAQMTPFTIPEGATLGGYIDVFTNEIHTAVLGDDGYYHLNSVDGPIILVDMNYQDIILSAALQSDRPVMYAYVTDEEGNTVKYDIGKAIKAYEAIMDENGYYPLTEDLILFYDTYAVGAGVYTFYVSGNYNEENIWMYCMRTMTLPAAPVNPVDSWNLVLNDDLKVNFNLNVADITAEQLKITVAGEEVPYVLDGNTVSICLAAAQMNDEITIEIINSDTAYETKTYTVRQYADTVLADEELSKYHPIIKEMLNYGGAAQIYFDHNTGNLANAGIEGVAAAEIPDATDDYTVSGTAEGIAFYGASLVYRDKIAVRFYFTGSIEGITFSNGDVVERDGKYYIEIADILPQDLDDQITVTATDANGNTLTVTYGPMNYIVRMSQKDNANLTALLKALYNYHLAAKALREAV